MILKIIKVKSGYTEETNCYIVADPITKEAMVIDPGGEAEKIIEMLDALNVNLKYIFLTHCHGDHIGGVLEVKQAKGGIVLIYKDEAKGLKNKGINLSEIASGKGIELEADSRLNDGDLLHIGNTEFRVIHTPGHTKGGACLYSKQEGMLFSGDTLFRSVWGRTDLPTSSFEDIMNSITHKLMILPQDTIVYPGHGKATMIKDEENIYLGLSEKGG